MAIVILVFVVLGAFLVGNGLGWAVIRRGQKDARPFNWRVLLGAWLYYPWLTKWENSNEH